MTVLPSFSLEVDICMVVVFMLDCMVTVLFLWFQVNQDSCQAEKQREPVAVLIWIERGNEKGTSSNLLTS